MKKLEIKASKNYNQFKINTFNRDLAKVPALEDSMRKYGFIPSKPLIVQKNGRGFVVIEGNHRFATAKKLGIPFYYMVVNGDATDHPTDIETSTRPWTSINYLTAFCNEGRPEYLAIRKYRNRTGFSITHCVRLLAGIDSHRSVHDFKFGNFKRGKDQRMASEVELIAAAIAKTNKRISRHGSSIAAMISLIQCPEFSTKRLVQKIETFPGKLIPQADTALYLTMFEEIYNYKSGSKVPLAHLAAAAAKVRRGIKK